MNSMASLQEVRKTIVDAQVNLADQSDGQLFWMLDWMRIVIRTFLTCECHLVILDRSHC